MTLFTLCSVSSIRASFQMARCRLWRCKDKYFLWNTSKKCVKYYHRVMRVWGDKRILGVSSYFLSISKKSFTPSLLDLIAWYSMVQKWRMVQNPSLNLHWDFVFASIPHELIVKVKWRIRKHPSLEMVCDNQGNRAKSEGVKVFREMYDFWRAIGPYYLFQAR